MSEEEQIPEMPAIDPMTVPPSMRVNLLINEMMNLVDHMTQLKAAIDHTMAELMHGHPHAHDHSHDHDHNHDVDCCDDPECGSKEEE